MDNDIFNDESQTLSNSIDNNISDDIEGNDDDSYNTNIIYPKSIDDIPSIIIKNSFLLLKVMIIVALAIIGSQFFLPNFNYIEMAIAALILALYAAARAYLVLNAVLNYGYVIYKGEVINIYPERFDKKSFIVQLYDETRDAYISFNYSRSNNISEGSPVTLYLSPNEPIVDDENYGDKVNGYLAVVFSKDNSIKNKNKKKTVADIISAQNDK